MRVPCRLITLLCGFLLAECFLLWSPASAWTEGAAQPYPDGEAPVFVHRFCPSGRCDDFSQADWRAAIRYAMAQWNNAGANFRFVERTTTTDANPCSISGAVVVMFVRSGSSGCSQDQVVFEDIQRRGRDWHGLAILWNDGPHVYIKPQPNQEYLRLILVHEFGHVVGLGHPREAGQNVEAVMNLRSPHSMLQPDDIAGIQALYGKADTTPPTVSTAGFLGSPAPNATVSGIGFVSGWKCDAQDITVRIDGGPPMDMLMGVLREDTRSSCNGEAGNGFITQVNWNHLSAGTHTAVAYDNGIEFDRSTFTVGTTGEDFLHGVAVDIDVPDFPTPGQTSRFVWNQSTQHLELAEVYPGEEEPIPPPVSTTAVSRFNGKWLFSSSRFNMTCTIAQGVVACNKDWKLGTVSTSGDITIDVASSYFQGRLEGNAGAGTWIYYGESAEDGREWTATKQSSLASITSPVCGTLRGLQVEDYDDNFGRWDIMNPCASWNGHSNVLHIDIIPLSPAGFDTDAEDLMIIQGNQVATYDEDTPDLSRSAVWVDRQTQVVEAYTILPYRLTEAPYRLTVLVGQNAGIDLRRPFVLLYAEKVVAIFE